MVCQGVHHHSKRKDVASHDEDKEDDLCSSKEFTSKCAHHHLAGVGHTVYVRIRQFELSEGVAGVCGYKAKADD